MIKAASFAFLAGGILSVVLGIISSNATSSDASRFFVGSAAYNATLMIVGGLVGTAIGVAGLLHVSRR